MSNSQTNFEANTVQQAIIHMNCLRYRGKSVDSLPNLEILRALDVFRDQCANAIVKHGTDSEIHQLIQRAAEEINALAATLTSQTMHKLGWIDYQKPIVEKLEKEFSELFSKVNEDIRQQNIQRNLRRQIEDATNRTTGFVTALISTEEEANEKKLLISENYSRIKDIIIEADLVVEMKNELFVELDQDLKKMLDFVDEKLAEEPVKVYYYKSGNRVAVKVKLNRSGYGYLSNRAREVRFNRKDDAVEYPLIVSVSYILDFLYHNKVRDEDIWVDPRSLDQFYTFNSEISVKLTPAFIRSWYNYDCPDIYRCSPNKQLGTNMLGQPIAHFSNKLVESTWSAVYIDEDITEEEVACFSNGYDNRITKEMYNVLHALKLKESGEIEKVKEFVEDMDTKIQITVNMHQNEILDYLREQFADRVVLQATGTDGAGFGFSIDDNFGLDCGFINIQSNHQGYSDMRSMLNTADKNYSKFMGLKMPYWSQSNTLNKVQFRKVAEIVKREMGIELFASFILD